jgi:hypothetical protein
MRAAKLIYYEGMKVWGPESGDKRKKDAMNFIVRK